MCGIIGIVGKSSVNQALYDGLTMLQHRGQDAAGIVTCDNERLYLRKNNGLVRDVFHIRHMLNLRGHMGIGHVRYPTAGCESGGEAQPFYVNSPYGITLAHNGNLTNAEALKKDLFREQLRHINTDSDSEVLLNVFAHELYKLNKLLMNNKDVFEAVRGVHRRCRGGYAAVAMITGLGIVAFRDPYGIRPVVFGKRETDSGTEYMVASESVAMDVLGFELVRDIAPGEAIFITADGQLYTRQCAGILVYKARLQMGKTLAKKILRLYPNHDIDVVIPIPDTSRTAAVQLAHVLARKYREGFVKNRYIPRTFIMPGQSMRKKSVRQKLNAIGLEFKNKNVLLVDDSIVRGTTCQQIIQMAREAGAKKVYFASAAPPVRYPNVYGIDMPSAQELLAHNRTIDDLIACARKGNKSIKHFDASCFTGHYVTGDVDQGYLDYIERYRNDAAKAERQAQETEVIDLYNVA